MINNLNFYDTIMYRLTVNKEGPNKGREFYACPKGRGNGCNFFQWADEQDGGQGRGGGAGSHFPSREEATVLCCCNLL